jgi:hypothetical protein
MATFSLAKVRSLVRNFVEECSLSQYKKGAFDIVIAIRLTFELKMKMETEMICNYPQRGGCCQIRAFLGNLICKFRLAGVSLTVHLSSLSKDFWGFL